MPLLSALFSWGSNALLIGGTRPRAFNIHDRLGPNSNLDRIFQTPSYRHVVLINDDAS